MWPGGSEKTARNAATRDLARLERTLAEQDARLPDDGTVRLAFACAEIDNDSAPLHELIGRALASSTEWKLAERSIDSLQPGEARGEK
jgi:hypothetical protein